MRHPDSLDQTIRMPGLRFGGDRGRRILLAVFCVAVVGALVASAVFSAGDPAPVAQLRIRDDTVEVQHPDEDFEEAAEGEELEFGDVVRTTSSGRAQVDYFDGSLTRLDVFSELAVRRLADEPGRRLISVGVNAGRTWNRVTTPTSDDGRFEVHFQNAVASVEGTTFVVDCSRDLHCYVLGIADTTRVEAGEDSASVKAGECVDLVGETLLPCDANQLGLIDDWIKQNLAEDQQLDISATTTPSPSPSLSPSPTPRPRSVVRPTPTPSPTPTPPTPTPTKTPKPTPKKTPKPATGPTGPTA